MVAGAWVARRRWVEHCHKWLQKSRLNRLANHSKHPFGSGADAGTKASDTNGSDTTDSDDTTDSGSDESGGDRAGCHESTHRW